VHQQCSTRAGSRLRKLLGDRHPEREAGVHQIRAEVLGRRHATFPEGAEPDFPREPHALLKAVEGATPEEIRSVYGMAGFPQVVGERPDAVGQALNVVEEQNLSHVRGVPRPLIDCFENAPGR
jgi:hypothetical protein